MLNDAPQAPQQSAPEPAEPPAEPQLESPAEPAGPQEPEAAPDAFVRKEPLRDEDAGWSFTQQVQGVLFSPWIAFAQHDESWGWGRAWLLTATVGVLFGFLYLARIDVVAVLKEQQEVVLDRMPAAKRKALENPQGDGAETMEKLFRFQAFMAKVGLVAGPPLIGLVGMLFVGGFIYLATKLFGPDPPDLMRCLSIAAFAGLVGALEYGAMSIGVLGGNPEPITSLGAFVGKLEDPVLHTALSRVNPFTVFYYVVLVAGLEASCGLSRRKACGVACGLFALGTVILLGLAGLSAMRMG